MVLNTWTGVQPNHSKSGAQNSPLYISSNNSSAIKNSNNLHVCKYRTLHTFPKHTRAHLEFLRTHPHPCYVTLPLLLRLLTAKPTSVFCVITANDVAGPSEVMEHHDGKEQIT